MKNFTLIEWMILVAIVAIIGSLLVTGINSVGIETRSYSGLVVDKHYKAGYTSTSTTVVDGIARVSSTYHPPVYTIYVGVEGEKVSCPVS